MSIAYEIKTIRQKAFLTQTEFAKEINVSFSTVNRWESGKTRPNMKAMKQISKFCEKSGIVFSPLQDKWLEEQEGADDDNK